MDFDFSVRTTTDFIRANFRMKKIALGDPTPAQPGDLNEEGRRGLSWSGVVWIFLLRIGSIIQ